MFSSFLRSTRRDQDSRRKNGVSDRGSVSRTPQVSPSRFDEDEYVTTEDEDVDEELGGDEDNTRSHESENEDGSDAHTPLLPIFSSTHLDVLPVYIMTHTIRELVISRCETVLTWDQLRSPQVSQFLLKPIQQEIRSQHFNAATEYALMTNCLQFEKEAGMYPGNSGTSRTRSMLCELLAIKLLREYTSRELIDALSYDFDPLQGWVDSAAITTDDSRQKADHTRRLTPRAARISCYDVALRAQAKQFLAHPVIVQQLEAIWAGTIVFHSAADSMHRHLPSTKQYRHYGTINAPSEESSGAFRKMVSIYNPGDASLFKLSRLRVPKYRNILSNLSFAVLLALFVAVLVERTIEISVLEITFWFWAAGYMLDEIVGFSEQGFSLYLASFWNTFDLGILLLLFVHLCLRLYGILMPDVHKHATAHMAYDILAANAILLFPRLFSVLDHYRYFSQLLIAFRLMARDLFAVTLLILVSTSGFFVALSLSFGSGDVDTPSSVAYALLQMVMGFTPAVWDRWDAYNTLGKFILVFFLFICHFLIVTILVTVLTNSFMTIARNANEEHQFVFAVNTISSVKSDALFSYVAPANVIEWLLTPLRYIIPFQQYVKVNRTIIKITHFPILFTIYIYERIVLDPLDYDSMDVIEKRERPKKLHSSRLSRLAREPSITTFRQDRALEEVFQRPFDSASRHTQRSRDNRVTSNVVKNWMQNIAEEDLASLDSKSTSRADERQPSARSFQQLSRSRNFRRRKVSVVSDPENLNSRYLSSPEALTRDVMPSHFGLVSQVDYDTNQDLNFTSTEDEGDNGSASRKPSLHLEDGPGISELRTSQSTDYFSRLDSANFQIPNAAGSAVSSVGKQSALADRRQQSPGRFSPNSKPHQHARNFSSATMIYKPNLEPPPKNQKPPLSSTTNEAAPKDAFSSGAVSPVNQPTPSSGHRTPKRNMPSHLRPTFPSKENVGFQSAPNLASFIDMRKRTAEAQQRHHPSLEVDLVSDLGDNKAIGGGYVGAIPASLLPQMRQSQAQQKQKQDEQDMLGRLMMARMNGLEESFREVIHEMRETMKHDQKHARSRTRSKSKSRSPKPRTPRSLFKRARDGNASPTTTSSNAGSSKNEANVSKKAGGSSLVHSTVATPVVTTFPKEPIASHQESRSGPFTVGTATITVTPAKDSETTGEVEDS